MPQPEPPATSPLTVLPYTASLVLSPVQEHPHVPHYCWGLQYQVECTPSDFFCFTFFASSESPCSGLLFFFLWYKVFLFLIQVSIDPSGKIMKETPGCTGLWCEAVLLTLQERASHRLLTNARFWFSRPGEGWHSTFLITLKLPTADPWTMLWVASVYATWNNAHDQKE